jgi:hypothetical protein
MKSFVMVCMLLGLCGGYAEAKIYKYSDYTSIRNEFDDFCTAVNDNIESVNNGYVRALTAYKKCSSNSWRAAFVTVIPEIDERRSALDQYKQEAYSLAGKQNYEILKIARENNINKVQPDEDISEFVIWYKNHISFMKSGPFHELRIYIDGYEKLTAVYVKMAESCAGDASKAGDFDLVTSGIKGLLDSVLSLIDKVK